MLHILQKDVELKEIDYPPPEPSTCFDTSEIDFTEVDEHALNVSIYSGNIIRIEANVIQDL